ncbi:tRNA-splicing endonuclease subunit Sen15, partial [Acipenser oxyrinchus oxyrinchus]
MEGVGGSAEESGDVADSEGTRGDMPGNWILQHHKYRELMALDVGDAAQVYAAFLVYLDLLEERRWQEVTSRGSAELQLVYLEGRESESQPRQLIVPLPGQRSLSHQGVRSAPLPARPDGTPLPPCSWLPWPPTPPWRITASAAALWCRSHQTAPWSAGASAGRGGVS